MSTSNVLLFEDYRCRRAQRLRIAESLCGASERRLALLTHVADTADVTGADRAAVVWVDEYNPGLVHPHVILDLRSDRPRRSFASEPLRQAWELGVPGAFDEPGTDAVKSTLAVALGSDGTRAWFLVADSAASRAELDRNVRERVMFLAGECSAVVMHRDLDAPEAEPGAAGDPGRGFAGWPSQPCGTPRGPAPASPASHSTSRGRGASCRTAGPGASSRTSVANLKK